FEYTYHCYLISFPTRRSSDLVLLTVGIFERTREGRSFDFLRPRDVWISVLALDMAAISEASLRVFSNSLSLPFLVTPLLFLLLRSEEHTSELQSLRHLVCRLL